MGSLVPNWADFGQIPPITHIDWEQTGKNLGRICMSHTATGTQLGVTRVEYST